jgi:hypothetical protein
MLQKNQPVVEDTRTGKNVVKYARNLSTGRDYGVLVVITNFDPNQETKCLKPNL